MEPHGFCIFNLPIKYFNATGKHHFLNWSLKSITGNFVHGKIEGIGKLLTWQGQTIWATFKDGILHGPAYQYGIVPILDSMDVSFIYISTQLFQHNVSVHLSIFPSAGSISYHTS